MMIELIKIKKYMTIFFLTFSLVIGTGAYHHVAALKAQPSPIASPQKAQTDITSLSKMIVNMEDTWSKKYEQYFGQNFFKNSLTLPEMGEALSDLAEKTGNKSAILWVYSTPDALKIILTTAENHPLFKSVNTAALHSRPNSWRGDYRRPASSQHVIQNGSGYGLHDFSDTMGTSGYSNDCGRNFGREHFAEREYYLNH